MNWYLVLRHDPHPITVDDPLLGQHLTWMRAQHGHGTIVMSGPARDRSTGLYVVRAHSRDDAARVAAEDPLAAHRQARIEIIEWEVHQIQGTGPFDVESLRAMGFRRSRPRQGRRR